MIIGDPADTPVTIPDIPTVASATLLLLHEPPNVASFNGIEEATQTVPAPVTAAGSGFTVTTADVLQPVGKVYVIVALPAAFPVTKPDGSIDATAGLLLFHVPPPASESGVVSPLQTANVPDIDNGSGLTVNDPVLLPVTSVLQVSALVTEVTVTVLAPENGRI